MFKLRNTHIIVFIYNRLFVQKVFLDQKVKSKNIILASEKMLRRSFLSRSLSLQEAFVKGKKIEFASVSSSKTSVGATGGQQYTGMSAMNPSSEEATKQAKREHLERQCFSQGRHSPVWPFVFGAVLLGCCGAVFQVTTSMNLLAEGKENARKQLQEIHATQKPVVEGS